MLSDEIKYENKVRFLNLLTRLNIDLTPLYKYLEDINYFEQPATAQYQFSYAGGLCEQALKLCHELGVLCEAYFPNKYTEEDIIKVALFKELYRAEMYELYNKNIKDDETGTWKAILAYRTKENRIVYGDLGFSSYMIAKRFISFSDEQIEALVHSTGLNNYSIDIHDILKKYPLVTLTKMADMVVNYLSLNESETKEC